MKFFEESMAKAASLTQVEPGQRITVKTDLILGHDGTFGKLNEAWKATGYTMSPDSKLLFTIDHAYPAPTIGERQLQKEMLLVSQDKQFDLYHQGEGVLHQVVAEQADLTPGMIIVGADGHVATAGAYGAIAFSEKPGVVAKVIATGSYELTVPEVVTFVLNGQLKPHVMARDIALYLLGNHPDDMAAKAVALTGSYIEGATADSRMALCNLLPEGGAFTAFIPPVGSEVEGQVIQINVESIGQMMAIPPSPTTVRPIEELAGKKITVAIIGGCSSGRLEDLEAAAQVLKGRTVDPNVTLIITPASAKIADEMDLRGLGTILRQAGATIMPPGCGPCPGKHFGVLSPDDVAITTTIRNSPGRIGADEAEIYLASPYSTAQAALSGMLFNPEGS